MAEYRNVPDPAEYEQAMRDLREVLDSWPLLHYAVPVTQEQVDRDNAAYRRRLAIERGEVTDETPDR